VFPFPTGWNLGRGFRSQGKNGGVLENVKEEINNKWKIASRSKRLQGGIRLSIGFVKKTGARDSPHAKSDLRLKEQHKGGYEREGGSIPPGREVVSPQKR